MARTSSGLCTAREVFLGPTHHRVGHQLLQRFWEGTQKFLNGLPGQGCEPEQCKGLSCQGLLSCYPCQDGQMWQTVLWPYKSLFVIN